MPVPCQVAIAPYHLRLEIVPCPKPETNVAANQIPQVVYNPVDLTLITPVERLAEIFTATIPASQLTVVLTDLDSITAPQEISR